MDVRAGEIAATDSDIANRPAADKLWRALRQLAEMERADLRRRGFSEAEIERAFRKTHPLA